MKEKEDDVDDADYLIDDPNYPRQLLLLISEIKVPDAEWRAPLNEETVQQLMSSIASVGLIEPVQIDLDCVLRIGRHRFEAIRRLGWKYIPVTIFEGLSEDEWRLRVLDENLERNQSTVYQRCLWIRERKILYERLYPQTQRGVAGGLARYHGEGPTEPAFTTDTAIKTHKARRTVELYAFISDKLCAYKSIIPSTKIANSLSQSLLPWRELSRWSSEARSSINSPRTGL